MDENNKPLDAFVSPLPSALIATDPRAYFPEIIGNSHALTEVLYFAAKIAPSASSVLILGESGTGKELIASALHRLSPRSHKAFIAINCSAIPEDLLESELFGHEKGAFTGADRKRLGHFGAAHQGTLFLDEIGDMPLRLQAKLLRILQEKKYSPLGSQELKDADVRIIAATNKNLDEAIKSQTFRLDLYYRLNVLPITLPPLRERMGDIPLLVQHFLNLMNRLNPHLPESWLCQEALVTLERYTWPGNIRQLHNVLERIFVIKAGGQLSKADLPKEIREPATDFIHTPIPITHHAFSTSPHTPELPRAGINLNHFIAHIEDALIQQALIRTGFNKNQAAKLLGLNRTTLVERLKKKNILTPT